MNGSRPKVPAENISIINRVTVFVGKYIGCQETLIIKGRLEGEVETGGNVIVDLEGEANADLKAGNIHNFGTIKGNVRVKERLEIKNTGKINGNVSYKILDISEGGIFNGKCAHSAEEKLTPKI